MKVYPDVF